MAMNSKAIEIGMISRQINLMIPMIFQRVSLQWGNQIQ